jgi:hypothetical protein
MGARIDEDLRHFVLARFPFSIVYALTGDVVYIVALAHGSREPEYWKHTRSRRCVSAETSGQRLSE